MILRDSPSFTSGGEDPCEAIALRIAEQGWCVTADFLPALHVAQLRHETLDLWRQGSFRHAGVGRGKELRVRTEVRTDWVNWLDPEHCSGAQRLYLEALERLRQAVNRTLLLGLFEFEGHLAVYPQGTYYRQHLDQFHGVALRTLTCSLYLNQDWGDGDGGDLRLYTDPEAPTHYVTIPPTGGTLVTFLSARFLHEVLPAGRERLSITGWFKRRDERWS